MTLLAAFLTSVFGITYAHHPYEVYDTNRTIELTGVVAGFRLLSPHSLVTIDVENEDGTTKQWVVETVSEPVMRRMGFDERTFKPGDVITVIAWPNPRPNSSVIFGTDFFASDGTKMGKAPTVPEADPTDPDAKGVAKLVGRWMIPPPSAADETPLPLTPAGRRAWEQHDPRLSPANTCEYVNMPSLFYAPFLYDIQIDANEAVLTYELFNVTRRVLLNGEPQKAEETGLFGLVSGRIKGDELVIESSNYPPSDWGLAIAGDNNGAGRDVPSSAQKQILERYSVTNEGNLRVDYVLEDPVYLKERYSNFVEFTRVADDTPIHPWDCDTESAAKYLQ